MQTTILHRARPRVPRSPSLQSASALDSAALASILGLSSTSTSRVPVSEGTVRGLAGADAAVRKIGGAVAQMMSAATAFGPDGQTPLGTQPLVLTEPDPFLDPFVYWRSLTEHGLMRGNWVGIKHDIDPTTGYPRQVQGVPMDAVTAYYRDGYPTYQIAGDEYTPDDVVHVRFGYVIPGQILAVGFIEAHRRNLVGMLDQQSMSNGVWRNNGTPTGIVRLDVKNPTVDQATTVKANWVQTLDGQRTVAVIGQSMEFTPISWNADDAQFLESRQFSIAESAIMLGLRPEDLGASFGASSGAQSYGNRSDDALQRIIDAYTPVMMPIEQAWSRLIPGRNFVNGSPEALLRGTTRERYELRFLAQAIGIETPAESRAEEGKPPAPPAAALPPPTPPTPPTPPAPPSPTGDPS